jgi:glucose-6-phosphate dehydrogenase-like protein OpcA
MSASLSPDALLRDMSNLWVTLGKQGPAETGLGVLRACTMTLIVVAEEEENPSALAETLAALMPEHPARSVVVRLRHDRRTELAGRVFAQCWMPFGQRRQICCEQIEITASDDSLGDAGSVVGSITAADLPVVVWGRSVRTVQRPEFWSFAASAGKVVVDTASWPDRRSALQRLIGLAGHGAALGDLSWTRLTRWRESLAQFFENAAYAARLPQISRVRVRFDEATMDGMARYLGAWLMGAVESAGARPELSIEPGATAFSLELSGPDFHLELARRQERLITTIGGSSHCTHLPRPGEYPLLREELGIIGHDPVFERTLARAARL